MSALRDTYGAVTHSQVSVLLRNMTTNGLPDGTDGMAVNGSITPVRFYIEPPVGLQFEYLSLGVSVSDGGVPDIDDYGSIVGGLTNGVQFYTIKKGVEDTTFEPVKNNRGLIALSPGQQQAEFTANTFVRSYTFDLGQHSDAESLLNSSTNDQFGVIIQDDLTSLLAHTIVVKGNMRLRNI